MLEALCEHLTEKPGLYLEEMAVFLYDEFGISVSPSSIKRTLSFGGWMKRKPSKEQENGTLIYKTSTTMGTLFEFRSRNYSNIQ
jgi:transposase